MFASIGATIAVSPQPKSRMEKGKLADRERSICSVCVVHIIDPIAEIQTGTLHAHASKRCGNVSAAVSQPNAALKFAPPSPLDRRDEDIVRAQATMAEASRTVLSGFGGSRASRPSLQIRFHRFRHCRLA